MLNWNVPDQVPGTKNMKIIVVVIAVDVMVTSGH